MQCHLCNFIVYNITTISLLIIGYIVTVIVQLNEAIMSMNFLHESVA